MSYIASGGWSTENRQSSSETTHNTYHIEATRGESLEKIENILTTLQNRKERYSHSVKRSLVSGRTTRNFGLRRSTKNHAFPKGVTEVDSYVVSDRIVANTDNVAGRELDCSVYTSVPQMNKFSSNETYMKECREGLASLLVEKEESTFPSDVLFHEYSNRPLDIIDLSCWVSLLHWINNDKNGRRLSPIEYSLCNRFNLSHQELLDIDKIREFDVHKKRFSSLVLKDCPTASNENIDVIFYSLGRFFTSVEIEKCPLLTHQSLYSIRNYSKSLESLKLSECQMITNSGLSNFFRAFKTDAKPMLESITLCRMNQIRDECITMLAKSFRNIIKLQLLECQGISDAALISISDNVRGTLEDIDLSGCDQFTDYGVKNLIGKCILIRRLSFSRCPLLTDDAFRCIYDKEVIYGYRRQQNCRLMHTLELSFNPNITQNMLAWVAMACPHLMKLDVQGCSNLFDGEDMFEQLSHLSKLTYLDVGDCLNLLDKALWIFVNKSMSVGLQYLNLSGIFISDDTLAVLPRTFPSIADIRIDRTLRSFDNVINQLVVCGESIICLAVSHVGLTNGTIEVIANACWNLKELDISANRMLTSQSIEHLNRLSELEKLDISSCDIDDSAFIKKPNYLLRKIVANSLQRLSDKGLRVFTKHHYQRISHIYIRNCPMISSQAVGFVASICDVLKVFDITFTASCFNIQTLQKAVDDSGNSLINLSFSSDPTFVGLLVQPSLRDERAFHLLSINNFIVNRAANIVQRVFRSHQEQQQKFRQIHKETIIQRQKSILIIQRHVKIFLKNQVKIRLESAKKTMVYNIQRLYRIRTKRRREMKVQVQCFSIWVAFSLTCRQTRLLAVAHHNMNLKRLSLCILLKNSVGSDNQQLALTADNFRRSILVKKSVGKWLESALSSNKIRKKNSLKFMCICNVQTFNTSYFIYKRRLAAKQTRLRLLCLSWRALFSFHLKKKKQKQEIHRAILYFQNVTKLKTCPDILRIFRQHAIAMSYKREQRKCAANYLLDFKRKIVVRQLRSFARLKKYHREINGSKIRRARKLTEIIRVRLVLGTFLRLSLNALYRNQQLYQVRNLRSRREKRSVISWLSQWKKHLKISHQKIKLSSNHWNVHVSAFAFRRWLDLLNFRRRQESKMIFFRMVALKKRHFRYMINFWRQNQESKRNAEIKLANATFATILFQTLYRGWKTRNDVRAWAVFREWAILLCQKQARVFLSRKQLERQKRISYLQCFLQQESEEYQMSQEDTAMHDFLHVEKKAITLQRLFRGVCGRLSALIAMKGTVLEASAMFHKEKLKDLMAAASQEEKRKWTRIKEIKAASLLSRLIRGFQGRKEFARIRNEKQKFDAAIVMQSHVRGRNERRKRAAMYRHKKNVIESLQIVEQMRCLDKLTRRFGLEQSAFFAKFVPGCFEQVNDIRCDLKRIQVFSSDFIKSWQEGRFDEQRRTIAWYKMKASHLRELVPTKGNAVRVINTRHTYTGMTGQLLYFQDGYQEAVVKMDVDGCLQRFQMPLNIDDSLDIMRIESMESRGLVVPSREADAWREAVAQFAEEELQRKTMNLAAKTIQKFILKTKNTKHQSPNRKSKKVFSTRACQEPKERWFGNKNSAHTKIFSEVKLFQTRITPTWLEKFSGFILNIKVIRSEYHVKITEGPRWADYSGIALNPCYWSHEDMKFLESYNIFVESKKRDNKTTSRLCRFTQLTTSPHVRRGGLAILYGKSQRLFNVFLDKPNGLGHAEFIKGYDIGFQEKTLTIKVCRARGIRAADYDRSSNPYVTIYCKQQQLKTSVQNNTSDPVWNEDFKIHVSDPKHMMKIALYDFNRFRPQFLGKVELEISMFGHGQQIRKWYNLMPRKRDTRMSKRRKNVDLGSIELIISWTDRLQEGNKQIGHQNSAVTIMQCFIRKRLAQASISMLRNAQAENFMVAISGVILIQSYCRKLLAARAYIKLRRMHKAHLCLKSFFLCRLASWKKQRMQSRYHAARCIQSCARKFRARYCREELNLILKHLRNVAASKIARLYRGYHSRIVVTEMKQYLPEFKDYRTLDRDWVFTYGRDIEYGLKRNKYILKRAYNRILYRKGAIWVTKYGQVYVSVYPALLKSNIRNKDKEMIQVFLYGHRILSLPKKERVSIHNKASKYHATVKLSDVNIMKSVCWYINIIQCFFRYCLSKKQLLFFRKRRFIVHFVQRKWRVRYRKTINHIQIIQKTFRMRHAAQFVKYLTKKYNAATMIQCAYRCHHARKAFENCLSIESIRVIDSSGCTEALFCALNTIDNRDESFWCSSLSKQNLNSSWILYENEKCSLIGGISIRCPETISPPKKLIISAGNAIDKDLYHVQTIQMDEAPKKCWQHFSFECTDARYLKLHITQVYGDSEVIISGVRFYLQKEQNINIVKQPMSIYVPSPPQFGGKIQSIELICAAAKSFPVPTYQWLKDGRSIAGATNSKLTINLVINPAMPTKIFKCIKCKRGCKAVPDNVQKVMCGYCKHVHDFMERKRNQEAIKILQSELNIIEERFKKISRCIEELETVEAVHQTNENIINKFRTPREITVFLEKLHTSKTYLMRQKTALSQQRSRVDVCKVKFDGEGLYTCIISNKRANETMIVSKSSEKAFVLVEDPAPLKLKCKREYSRREKYHQMKVPMYDSLFGSFFNGYIRGNVLITFEGGDQYFGPYIGSHQDYSKEKKGRTLDHWGLYRKYDGTIIEGSLVTNTFDVNNMQGTYRITFPDSEVFEGDIVDEKQHGKGAFWYSDGSVYTGDWFCGKREGTGRFLEKDGSFFEGDWENDVIHGDGIWSWSDGSTFVGGNEFGKRHGTGVFRSSNNDVYRGDFVSNNFHGTGIFTYSDGSQFEGKFVRGIRNGNGILTLSNGDTYSGRWENDQREGEFTVTRVIIDDDDQRKCWGSEIQTGIWRSGEFVQWTSSARNPRTTSIFCDKFLIDKEPYSGPLAIQIAKELPYPPEGVDENNSTVSSILSKIASACKEYSARNTIDRISNEINNLSSSLESIENKLSQKQSLLYKTENKMQNHEKAALRYESEMNKCCSFYDATKITIERFWMEEKTEARKKFNAACNRLKDITANDWFRIKRHFDPPAFLKSLMRATCAIMNVDETWEMGKILISSNAQNRDKGDKVSIWKTYELKLCLLLEDFCVYDRAEQRIDERILKYIEDPDFRDAYLLAKYGPAAKCLVSFVENASLYINTACKILSKWKLSKDLERKIKQLGATIKQQNGAIDPLRDARSNIEKQITRLLHDRSHIESKYSRLSEVIQKCKDYGIEIDFKGEIKVA